MKLIVLSLIFGVFVVRNDAAPLWEKQIATFVRDFFLSAGQMDQDDDDATKTNAAFSFSDDPLSSHQDETFTAEETSSAAPEGRVKKMLVFFKGDKNEEMKRRGRRDADADAGSKTAKKKLNGEEVRRILGQLRSNLKGKPIRMRTILDELDAIPGGFEFSELLNNSALSAVREFFRQIFLSLA